MVSRYSWAAQLGTSGRPIEVTLPNVRLWSPDQPFLYDLQVELLDGTHIVDTVQSYFGMRKIEVKKDASGINRLWLNNKVLFQYGPLDQGWWPDGLYTAPTDDALKYDIEMTKRLGMNMMRKHVKVEPARWYYWCDKLGLIVWQDMPRAKHKPRRGRKGQLSQRTQSDDRRPPKPSFDCDVGAVQRRVGAA